MPRVKEINTVVAVPQCEATRTTRYYSDHAGTDLRCSFSADYEVDGVKLCSRHAARQALNILKQEQ